MIICLIISSCKAGLAHGTALAPHRSSNRSSAPPVGDASEESGDMQQVHRRVCECERQFTDKFQQGSPPPAHQDPRGSFLTERRLRVSSVG